MFSLPRDTVDVPDPARAGAAPCRVASTRGKINAFFVEQPQPLRPLPGQRSGRAATTRSRRSSASSTGSTSSTSSRSTSTGFRQVVDAMGGVTINVQIPVVDDTLPGRATAGYRRLYIPSGHPAHDRRRGAPLRPLAPRARPTSTAAPASSACCSRCASRPTRRPSSRASPSSSTRSRRPSRPTSRSTSSPSCSASRREVDTKNIRSYVFTPPLYQRGRSCAARAATSSSRTSRGSGPRSRTRSRPTRPTRHRASASPRRPPASGSSTARATATAGRDLAGYLEYHGLAASAPRQRPPGAVPANTTIVVYNGAEADLAATIAYLEKTFGVTVDDRRPTRRSGPTSS